MAEVEHYASTPGSTQAAAHRATGRSFPSQCRHACSQRSKPVPVTTIELRSQPGTVRARRAIFLERPWLHGLLDLGFRLPVPAEGPDDRYDAPCPGANAALER